MSDEKKTQAFGFNSTSKDILDMYAGQEVVAHSSAGNVVYGVYTRSEAGYALFQPSIVTSPDGSQTILDDTTPTIAALPLNAVMPLKKGTLESAVKLIAKHREHDRGQKNE